MMSPLAERLPPATPALHRTGLLLGLALLLAGCADMTSTSAPRLTKDGAAARSNYAVTPKNIDAVRARALDTVNNTRSSAGLGPLALDGSLNSAAERHSASMSRQKRAWAFGEDGSSPIHRASQAGFQGGFLGEMVSETYQSEVQAIATWAAKPELRAILLDPRATRLGIGAFQDPDMKLWWTLNVGQ
ncbi:CAP domain-containing protein [Falsigemmobacter faecalis]|nr:CAP domain-containing protein [Falsigemmobacter faecalis]